MSAIQKTIRLATGEVVRLDAFVFHHCPDCVTADGKFKIAAVANIDQDDALDLWVVDSSKNMLNLLDDPNTAEYQRYPTSAVAGAEEKIRTLKASEASKQAASGRTHNSTSEPAAPADSVSSSSPASAVLQQGRPNSSLQVTISSASLEKALSLPGGYTTHARAVPHSKNGKATGFRIFQIVPGSFFELLQFQSGDTLCSINGNSGHDPKFLMSLPQDFQNRRTLELCRIRKGEESSIRYQLSPSVKK